MNALTLIPMHPELKWTIRLLAGLAATLLFSAGVHLGCARAAEANSLPFRIGFSSAMFTDVNENDARAAVKAWGQAIAKERGVPTSPAPSIFMDTETMLQSLQNQQVDALGMLVTEYEHLCRKVRFSPIFATYNAGRITEQYIVLVHQGGPVKNLSDLRGRNLVFHLNPRSCLARIWLDTLLARQGFKPASTFAGTITQNSKLAKVILPVFFRQSDACVATRSGYETMCELNPQIGKQLKVIAWSDEMLPAVFVFRADYNPPYKERLFAALRDLHKSPPGQQVLTVFKSEKLGDHPVSCLDSALELLSQYAQLIGSKAGTNGWLEGGSRQSTGGNKP